MSGGDNRISMDLPAELPEQTKVAVDLAALPKLIADAVAFQLRARDLQLYRSTRMLDNSETEAFLADAARNAAQRVVLEAEIGTAHPMNTTPAGAVSFADLPPRTLATLLATRRSTAIDLRIECSSASIDGCPICGRREDHTHP